MKAATRFVVSDANLRQIRVLHIVSAGALASSLQQSLFMPLLTRLPRPRVKSLVACLSPGAAPSAVLRQSGVPTYDLPLSRKRFSPRAFQELQQATRNFRPDVIQAWGHTAQIVSVWLRNRCEWKPRLVWSITETTPLAKNAGVIDRQKLKYAAKFSTRADRIVYSSEAAASAHRRVGFPDGGHETVPPGVDATRFKPDFAARRKLREQLNLPGETFVIGMYAPFQPEYDHPTLLKAVGELIKINPNIAVVLAGHGVQKGNAPLMALVGGGALATRVHLMGELSDLSTLFNACDVVCSSAVNDQSRMNIVMAMLCGVPCVATGIGAQGEIISQHGVAIEPGSPSAFVKGVTRVMQMTPEKRTFMAQGARKHALANYVYVRSLQKYLQLYYDLIGRQTLVAEDLPAPEVDPTLTVPPALPTEAELNAAKRKPVAVADWGDPDSLESKVAERETEELPQWRIEQEQERAKREAELAAKVAASQTTGDVLQVFEARNQAAPTAASPMTERARGVADDVEELLSPDLLASDAPPPPRVSAGPSGRKSSSASQPAAAAAPTDSAKQAALKAAQRAALQPINSGSSRPAAAKPAAAAAKPAAAAAVAPAAPSIDFSATQPVDLLSPFELLQTSPAPARASDNSGAHPMNIVTESELSPSPSLSQKKDSASPVHAEMASGKHHAPSQDSIARAPTKEIAPSTAQPASAVHTASAVETSSAAQSASAVQTASTVETSGTAHAASAAGEIEREPMDLLDALAMAPSAHVSDKAQLSDVASAAEKQDGGATELLPEFDLLPPTVQELAPPAKVASGDTQRANALPEIDLSLLTEAPAAPAQDAAPKVETSASPLGRLAKALASASIPAPRASVPPAAASAEASPANTSNVAAPTSVMPSVDTPTIAAVSSPLATAPSVAAAATRGQVGKARTAGAGTPMPADAKPSAKSATSSMTAALEKWNSSFDLGELSLMATGAWMTPTKANPATKREAESDELSGPEALSLITSPADDPTAETMKLETLAEIAAEAKRAANAK